MVSTFEGRQRLQRASNAWWSLTGYHEQLRDVLSLQWFLTRFVALEFWHLDGSRLSYQRQLEKGSFCHMSYLCTRNACHGRIEFTSRSLSCCELRMRGLRCDGTWVSTEAPPQATTCGLPELVEHQAIQTRSEELCGLPHFHSHHKLCSVVAFCFLMRWFVALSCG
jgi:hypothetical protein